MRSSHAFYIFACILLIIKKYNVCCTHTHTCIYGFIIINHYIDRNRHNTWISTIPSRSWAICLDRMRVYTRARVCTFPGLFLCLFLGRRRRRYYYNDNKIIIVTRVNRLTRFISDCRRHCITRQYHTTIIKYGTASS